MPTYMRFQTPLGDGTQLTIAMWQCVTTKQFMVKSSIGITEFDQRVTALDQYANHADAAQRFTQAINSEMIRQGLSRQPWMVS